MALEYLALATTPAVRAAQQRFYGRTQSFPTGAGAGRTPLGADEADFIAARDSFYLATVSETGWPYVQHRGGPPGFLHVRDDGRTLAFADLGGNRQLLSTGNLTAGTNDRVALFLMDYPGRTRLKVMGRARVLDAREEPGLAAELAAGLPSRARVERLFIIAVASFDWNCPQHITPRYTREEVETLVNPLRARIAELEARLAAGKPR